MAVSIACARAGCRHRGVPLFRYIADLAQSEPQIPLPVPAVLSRTVGNPTAKQTQIVHVYPTIASSLDSAVETLVQSVCKINEALARGGVALGVNSIGCTQTTTTTTMEEALRVGRYTLFSPLICCLLNIYLLSILTTEVEYITDSICNLLLIITGATIACVA